jgi:hypothetical protein
MLTIFAILQAILLAFMLFHDWLPLKPFNDIVTLKKTDGDFSRALSSAVNGLTVAIPLMITLAYRNRFVLPLSISLTIFFFYLLLTIGTLVNWWIPYLFGSSKKHKQQFNKFKNTHHFLPARKDHVIPNTLHVILHLQVWACLAISVYLLIFRR